MKFHRTGMLTFSSWLLMTPLADLKTGEIVYSAPMKYWQVEATFNSEATCNERREKNILLLQKIENRRLLNPEAEKRSELEFDAAMKDPPGTARKSRGLSLKIALMAQCVATDDRRLKEKETTPTR